MKSGPLCYLIPRPTLKEADEPYDSKGQEDQLQMVWASEAASLSGAGRVCELPPEIEKGET